MAAVVESTGGGSVGSGWGGGTHSITCSRTPSIIVEGIEISWLPEGPTGLGSGSIRTLPTSISNSKRNFAAPHSNRAQSMIAVSSVHAPDAAVRSLLWVP